MNEVETVFVLFLPLCDYACVSINNLNDVYLFLVLESNELLFLVG